MTPRYRSIPRIRHIPTILKVQDRDHGVCIDCDPAHTYDASTLSDQLPRDFTTLPHLTSSTNLTPTPTYHEPGNWHVIHKNPDPYTLAPTPDNPGPNPALDHIDNLITICEPHYQQRRYINQPRTASNQPPTRYDKSKPKDSRLISYDISRLTHTQIKTLAAKRHISTGQLYRELIDAALIPYLAALPEQDQAALAALNPPPDSPLRPPTAEFMKTHPAPPRLIPKRPVPKGKGWRTASYTGPLTEDGKPAYDPDDPDAMESPLL